MMNIVKIIITIIIIITIVLKHSPSQHSQFFHVYHLCKSQGGLIKEFLWNIVGQSVIDTYIKILEGRPEKLKLNRDTFFTCHLKSFTFLLVSLIKQLNFRLIHLPGQVSQSSLKPVWTLLTYICLHPLTSPIFACASLTYIHSLGWLTDLFP